ncbi:UNVERIFIED_CONTAM: hypothetical protein Slati_0983700 [Sesamum latifolium]|uniref:Uncharacterized protein n=1 Tax=Sesamum latifolium TaxID=2727402 RepID=A0AAW2XQZ5_9LAMI
MYCQATPQSIMYIDDILEASGQWVNFHKSSMVLSTNTDALPKRSLPQLLGLRYEEHLEKYLGLPSVVDRSRKGVFAYIRDRGWQCIYGWNEKNLSQTGNAIMIKSLIQSIPTYALSLFQLPDSLLNEIQSMISSFFWDNKDKRRIHWIN